MFIVHIFWNIVTFCWVVGWREYLWDKGLDFLRHGFALFYMEKQSIWAEAIENGDLEILWNRQYKFDISIFCIQGQFKHPQTC